MFSEKLHHHSFFIHLKPISSDFCTEFFITDRRCIPWLLRVIALIICYSLCSAQTALNSGWPDRVIDGAYKIGECDGLRFFNSSLNPCGYCVGGTSGLPENFGRDCKKKCGGSAIEDCDGVCGGQAYIDECSGECIGGNTEKTEKNIVKTSRDCSGFCSGAQYYTDPCGVCRTSGTPAEYDCTNKCYLPGQEHLKAELICGRCVGGSSDIKKSDVLDSCGKCKSDEAECPCNGTGTPDPCGVCQGGGKTCFRLVDFYPQAIPNDTEANIFVKGAYRGRTKNLKCIITLILSDNELGSEMDVKGSAGNGTHVRCRIKLPAGMYRVGISLDIGDNPEVDYVENTDLLVYDDLNYSDMSPSRYIFDRVASRSLTVTFTGSQVPSRPLICIINGEGWPAIYRLAKSEENTFDSCVIPLANVSMKISVAPSLNGVHSFKKSFPLIFYASPPDMKKYYIAEDGHAVVVVFDRPVNLCKLETCADILNSETMERLGENTTCKWATKQQLVISVLRPISGDPIRITFKRGVLKQDHQKYAMAKNDTLTMDAWYPQQSSNAQVAISGPSTVPSCGSFTLVGHFSSPKGEPNFFWTANRADQQPLEKELSNKMLASRTASLTLDASLLLIGINYTFILTAEHPGNEKYEARHDVMRMAYIGPLVTAFSDVMDKSSVPMSQEITLQAEVGLPECAAGDENIHLLWTVNNPRVKFDFSSRDYYVYKIAPYSLPENSVVIFTANAYFGNLLNVTTSRIIIRVEAFIMKAVIKGSSKRIAGNMYGELVLESGNVNDKIPLVYQWRCFDQNRQLCYNYARNATEALLITREQQKQPVLKIPCYKLKAGQKLTFELQTFNRNNRYQTTAVASATVVVQKGNVPQVVIQSVKVDGVQSVEIHPTTGAYNIPAQLPVLVHATVKLAKTKIRSIEWDVKGFSTPFTYSMKKENTYLSLEEGFLVDHGIYLIGLSACDGENTCGVANLTIHAVPGVTLCHLQVNPYVEYEPTEVRVSGCSIPIGRQPVTYQLFMQKFEKDFPFTPPQTSTTFNTVGPPALSGNYSQLSVQVCDRYGHCKLFFGKTVKVTPSETKVEDRMQLIKKAQISLNANNALPALSDFFIALLDPNVKAKSEEVEAALSAAEKATKNRYLTSGQLALIYSSMQPLLEGPDKEVKLKALDIMKRATTLTFAHQVKPPLSVLTLGHNTINSAIDSPPTDDDIMRKVRLTLSDIQEKIAPSLPVGRRILLEGKTRGQPTTLLFRQMLDRSPHSIKALSDQGIVEGTVVFEEVVRSEVRSWRCSKMKSCDGAVVSLTLYPGRAPYTAKDKFVSPIFDVALRRPDTGSKMPLKDKENAVRMSMTHMANLTATKENGMALKCFYWDDSNKEWSREGVLTMGIEGHNMNCWASHLTTFAVLEVYDGLSTASIVGIIVATLMGVFMFGMILFFFVRKKQENLSKVSTEALQPKLGKSHGMERSVARVKRLTP